MIKKLVLTVLVVLAALTLSACGLGETRLSSAEGAAYAAEVDEYVESWLVGYNECDFDKSHLGFDPEWEIKNDDAWKQDCEATRAALGAYQSKTLDHVEDRGDLRVVIYHVEFEKDPDVPLLTYFYIDDPEHLITGLELNPE